MLATPRIEKPGEQGIFQAMARHDADGWLVRNLGGLRFCQARQIPAVADFSLNAANAWSVGAAARMGGPARHTVLRLEPRPAVGPAAPRTVHAFWRSCCTSTCRCSTWSIVCFAPCCRRERTRPTVVGRAMIIRSACEIAWGSSIRCTRTSAVATRCTMPCRRVARRSPRTSAPCGSASLSCGAIGRRAERSPHDRLGLPAVARWPLDRQAGVASAAGHESHRRHPRHAGSFPRSVGDCVTEHVTAVSQASPGDGHHEEHEGWKLLTSMEFSDSFVRFVSFVVVRHHIFPNRNRSSRDATCAESSQAKSIPRPPDHIFTLPRRPCSL